LVRSKWTISKRRCPPPPKAKDSSAGKKSLEISELTISRNESSESCDEVSILKLRVQALELQANTLRTKYTTLESISKQCLDELAEIKKSPPKTEAPLSIEVKQGFEEFKQSFNVLANDYYRTKEIVTTKLKRKADDITEQVAKPTEVKQPEEDKASPKTKKVKLTSESEKDSKSPEKVTIAIPELTKSGKPSRRKKSS